MFKRKSKSEVPSNFIAEKSMLSRPWNVDCSDIQYTYIESVRPLPPQDSYDNLREAEDWLVSERGGLAFGGMMMGDRNVSPISPTWAALSHGGLRSNGRAAAAGWPSHRTLGLSDCLDHGAVVGDNDPSIWHGSPDIAQFQPNNKLYVGDLEEQYFEMSRLAGDIVSMDLSRDGSRAALIEQVGSNGYRLTIADLESGDRRYLSVPQLATVGATNVAVQFSPANDWILVFLGVGSGVCLVSADNGTSLQLPPVVDRIDSGRIPSIEELSVEVPPEVEGFERIPMIEPMSIERIVMAAGWWPNQSADSIALVLADYFGLSLACFDCASAQLDLVGRIKSREYDTPALQWPKSVEHHYVDLRVHPRKNLALVGGTEGRAYTRQTGSNCQYRIAQLDLDTCEITPLAEPLVAGDSRFERFHESWRWVETAQPIPVTLHDKLIESAQHHPPMKTPPTSVGSLFAADAMMLLNSTALAVIRELDARDKSRVHEPHPKFLNPSRDRTKDLDVRLLRPETLRAYEACMRYDMPDGFFDWMRKMVTFLSHKDIARNLSHPGLTQLCEGLLMMRDGESHRWDWTADRKEKRQAS